MAAEKQTKTVSLEGTFTILSHVDRLMGSCTFLEKDID
jgi:hypothetical protein